MQILFMLTGIPGSGKSYDIKRLNLEHLTKKIKKRLKTHLYNYAFLFIILITSNYCVSMLKYIQKNMFFIDIFN